MPTIIHFIVSFNFLSKKKSFLFLEPIIFSGIFFLIHKTNYFPFVSVMDAMVIVTLNLFASYLYSFLILLIFSLEKKHKAKRKPEVVKDENIVQYQNKLNELTANYRKVQDELNAEKLRVFFNERELKSREEEIEDIATREDGLRKKYQKQLESYNKEFEDINNDLLDTKRKERNRTKKYVDKVIDYYKNEIDQLKKYTKQLEAQGNQKLSDVANSYKKVIDVLNNEIKVQKNKPKTNLRGIEDKCKAINFSIGRVFTKKRHANKGFRGGLKISNDLYNKFSFSMEKLDQKKAIKILSILKEIYNTLKLFKLSLADYNMSLSKKDQIKLNEFLNCFGPEYGFNKNTKVIDVLSKVDSDPVSEYYSELLTICGELINKIRPKIK